VKRRLRSSLALLGTLSLLALSLPSGGAAAQGLPTTSASSAPGTVSPSPVPPVVDPDPLIDAQLAGVLLPTKPWFEYTRTFNEGSPIQVAVDPSRFPAVVGVTANIYVVAAKTRNEWLGNPGLTDVTGGPLSVTFAAGSIQSNVWTVDTGTLSGDAGASIGVGFDVVIDLDGSGDLSDQDLIDGIGAEAGFYVAHDVTLPGPHAVTSLLYSGGTWLGQKTYFPTDIASMGKLPLVAISHGNGHNYKWYDHIGEHLASYGYIVMSHQNNTVPGIETASITTLRNTDYIILNQSTIAGGVLDGHLDSHTIIWIGHSRGGEGVVRAYDAIFDGTTTLNTAYDLEDIKLISSIAPTDFLGPTKSHPHAVTFSLWTGGADSDLTGCASCNLCQTFHIFDRAEATRHSISLHGAGHGDFHDGGGSSWASGPCLIGRARTHTIMLGYLLPLLEHHIRGNIPARDFLWRQYESFHPISAPVDYGCVVVDLMYDRRNPARRFVIDDFQTNSSTSVASSGGAVSYTVSSLVEARLDDANGDFIDNIASDPMNGMTHAGPQDTGRGIVFEYDGADADITFTLPADQRDFSRFRHLSFRAVQATRNANTTAVLEDLTFTVTLRDRSGGESSIGIGSYGGGIEEPYQRTGCGFGTAGWAGEWETISIRLTDFLHDDTLDLGDIDSVVFEFGPSFGSSRGRLGLDEIEATRD
jgi:hypothetical protein